MREKGYLLDTHIGKQGFDMEGNKGKILIYKNEKGNTKIDVYFVNGELWLTQKALSELYQVTIPTINEHIKNIIEEGELESEATIRNFLIVQTEGMPNGGYLTFDSLS